MCSSQGLRARAVVLIKYCDKQKADANLVPKRAPGVHVHRIAGSILDQRITLGLHSRLWGDK